MPIFWDKTEMDNISLSISKQQLSELPTMVYDGLINVVERDDQALKALEYLSMQQVVGFDTETRPSFRKGQTHQVSLMQISTPERAFLFRLNKIGFTPGLRQFLENGSITKVGLSIKDDFFMLHKIADFTPGGFVELQQMVKQFGITDCSLQKIYGIIFGSRISKSQRLSNWEAPELSPAQQAYAALDAWACLHIFNRLQSGAFNPSQSPYLSHEKAE